MHGRGKDFLTHSSLPAETRGTLWTPPVPVRLLFHVDALDFEDHGPCAVVATGDHLVFLLHPACHDGAALQACIDVAGDGVPDLGAEGHGRSACDGPGISRCLREGVEPHMPEMVIVAVSFEDKGVAHIVAGAGAGIWV